MSQPAIKTASTFLVRRSFKNNGVETEVKREGDEGMIAVHIFQTEPAKVGVDYAVTINTGNFNSAKVGISVIVPAYKEELDDAYEFASKWVEDRMQSETDLIVANTKKNNNPL